MLYVLAVIGAVTVAVLLWRAFGPQRARVSAHMAPDDDPEFLQRLAERHKNNRPDGDTGDGPANG